MASVSAGLKTRTSSWPSCRRSELSSRALEPEGAARSARRPPPSDGVDSSGQRHVLGQRPGVDVADGDEIA